MNNGVVRAAVLGIAATMGAMMTLACGSPQAKPAPSPAASAPDTFVSAPTREADGARRTSEPSGAWRASSAERWRDATESYVSSVKPGRQRALNTAAVPFAYYINAMHNRIHPLFRDDFLAALAKLPKTHPLDAPNLVTRVEIVLSPQEGRIVKMGIVRTSGVTAFDIGVLDSVQRAQPFGPAPSAIVSTDGNVYLHWELHRDEVRACSTMFAWPYLLDLPAERSPDDPQSS